MNNMPDFVIHGSTEEEREAQGKPASEVIERVNEILGYDVSEIGTDAEYERHVFSTPGVLEALDEALAEAEALRRSM
jgi:hypothetical protein